MSKTHSPYAPEYRRQMVELVHAGRRPRGAGSRVRVLGSGDPKLGTADRSRRGSSRGGADHDGARGAGPIAA